jgi:hypothetical protein
MDQELLESLKARWEKTEPDPKELEERIKACIEDRQYLKPCACEVCKTQWDVRKLPTPDTTPLHEAVKAENIGLMRSLLNQATHDRETWNKDGFTPLQYALANGLFTCVKTLLEYSASVTRKARDGRTAFKIAMDARAPEYILKLVAEYEQWHSILRM